MAGETTTTYDFEDGNAVFTADSRISVAIEDNATLSSKVVGFTCANNAQNGYSFAHYNFSSLVQKASIVTVNFDYYNTDGGRAILSIGDASVRGTTGGSSKTTYNGSGAIFRLGSDKNNAILNGTTNLAKGTYCDKWINVNVVVDVDNKKVTYTITDKSTSSVITSGETIDYYNSDANACSQIDLFGYINNNHCAMIDNLSITSYVDESEKYANYTIKYMYGETEIKAERIVESIKVGNDATITESDKVSIWYNDEKYIYSSDDAEGKTVAEDGSTVVIVSFRKATVEAYTINLINSANSEILIENAFSGNVIEGEASTVYYHKAVNVGGVWYVRAQNGGEPYYGISVVAGTNTVSYTENSGVSYFFEVEDLPVVKGGSYSGWRNDGLAGRSSGGQAPRHYAKNYAYTDVLEGGIYELVMNARNQSGSGAANTILAYMDENDNIVVLDDQFEDWAIATTAEKTVTVSIPDGARFVLKCDDYNSNLNMDFLMFTRIGDYTVSKSISAAGYATFCSPYALDFSTTGLTAYIATATKDEVSFSEVTSVPANTGVLLKGDADTYNIPVVASSATDVTANVFVGVTAATEIDAEAGFVLMNGNNGVGFYKNKNAFTVGANTAYIPVANIPNEGRSFIGFDDETTGISSLTPASKSEGSIYNLNGQRVQKAQKGLYIQGGKKFVVK